MIRKSFGILVTLAFQASLSFAQQPPAAQTPAHNTFILAGCLEAPVPGTSAFRLTDATPIGHAPPAGPAASDATPGKVTLKPAYLLQPVSGLHQSGVPADELKARVGQRVEVTVRPVDVVPPAPPTGASTTAAQSVPAAEAPQPFSVILIKPGVGMCQ